MQASQKIFFKAHVLIMIATVVLGEIRFFPLDSGFRFGLGSTAFVLGMILYPELITVRYSGLVGFAVVIFRIGLDSLTQTNPGGLSGVHLPTFFYYLILGFFLKQFKIYQFRDRPVALGAMVSLFDFLANTIELLLWRGFGELNGMGIAILEITAVAIGKGFVVIGIVSILTVYRLRIVQEEERLRYEKLLGLAAGLYQETFFLKKAMNHIEEIMAKSFELYQKHKSSPQVAGLALHVAEEVHEVKKDLQRVVAGLGRLVRVEGEQDVLSLKELLRITVGMNQEYIKSFGQQIRMKLEVEEDTKVTQIHPLISILNNLLANAIEAIAASGKNEKSEIICRAFCQKGFLVLTVWNNGPDIPEDEQKLIFEPGYTTKYTFTGVAATGIGLTHVKEIVEQLKGTIRLTSGGGKTEFVVEIPMENL
jgi:two-component system, sensor histidine kinase YcbA